AMGGREVGGLSNMLACHLDLESARHADAVQSYWNAPNLAERPGLKAVDLFRACADGRIKALWIMSTNPAVSMPEADAVRDAISACDFVVVSDLFADTDTALLANVVLPAAGWGEKSGTVTNSDRTISRQRPFLPMPGDVRPDWKIISDVAAAMGWGKEFNYRTPADIFREHAGLSGIAGALGRDFDISGLATLSDDAYEGLQPTRWPITAARQGGRFFADGRFYTPDARARMIPVQTREMSARVTQAHPLRLNTGRVRDQWHTMTRTARASRLNLHMAEPYVEVHPRDAETFAIEPAGLVSVSNGHGKMLARALVTDRTPPGSVFVPMHWTSSWASNGRIDATVTAAVDPISGQPELKGAAVSIAPYRPSWYGFTVSKSPLRLSPEMGIGYWAKATTGYGWRCELAGDVDPICWEAYARSLFGAAEDAPTVMLQDLSQGRARVAVLHDGDVLGAVFIDREPVAVARSHVLTGFGALSPVDLLAARPGLDMPDPGAIVCSCFQVGANTIAAAVAQGGLQTVQAIGEATCAGTNCGSCRPELTAFLTKGRALVAAE
ncbi:MAG: molybdopterin dinucleotide binding domain-containing protein, partial [Pseudomonadota bacterium]